MWLEHGKGQGWAPARLYLWPAGSSSRYSTCLAFPARQKFFKKKYLWMLRFKFDVILHVPGYYSTFLNDLKWTNYFLLIGPMKAVTCGHSQTRVTYASSGTPGTRPGAMHISSVVAPTEPQKSDGVTRVIPSSASTKCYWLCVSVLLVLDFTGGEELWFCLFVWPTGK